MLLIAIKNFIGALNETQTFNLKPVQPLANRHIQSNPALSQTLTNDGDRILAQTRIAFDESLA
jgi:hypothetical protein